MKWVLGFLDRMRPQFQEGGKLHALRPAFAATESFFFSSETCTTEAPHLRDPLDVKRFMFVAIIALLPSTFAALYFFGLRVLAMIVVSYAVGGAVETLIAMVRKEEINEGFLVTGLIFPLVLPPALPLWMVGLGVAFGVIVGKELFGGTGRNLFNPALIGRCFLALGYPVAMAGDFIKPGQGPLGRLVQYVGSSAGAAATASKPIVDAITSATPLVMAKRGEWASLKDLFLGNVAGSAGETSALAIIAGGIFLLVTGVASWRTVAGVLGSFAILGAALHHVRPETFGPVAWHLCAGGLLFGAFFMATDPVTSPVSNGAKWAYGIIIGVVSLLIRNLTGYVEGVMFAILVGNIAAPLIDHVSTSYSLRRLPE